MVMRDDGTSSANQQGKTKCSGRRQEPVNERGTPARVRRTVPGQRTVVTRVLAIFAIAAEPDHCILGSRIGSLPPPPMRTCDAMNGPLENGTPHALPQWSASF